MIPNSFWAVKQADALSGLKKLSDGGGRLQKDVCISRGSASAIRQ